MEDSASVRVRRQGCLAVEAEYINNTDISEPRSTTDHIAHVASLAHPPPLHLLALHLLPLIVCSVGSLSFYTSLSPALLHTPRLCIYYCGGFASPGFNHLYKKF